MSLEAEIQAKLDRYKDAAAMELEELEKDPNFQSGEAFMCYWDLARDCHLTVETLLTRIETLKDQLKEIHELSDDCLPWLMEKGGECDTKLTTQKDMKIWAIGFAAAVKMKSELEEKDEQVG